MNKVAWKVVFLVCSIWVAAAAIHFGPEWVIFPTLSTLAVEFVVGMFIYLQPPVSNSSAELDES